MYLLLLSFLFSLSTSSEYPSVPSLIKFSIDECEDCTLLDAIWPDLNSAFDQDDVITLDEINCNLDEELCFEYQITTFPSVLFVKDAIVREYEGEKTVDGISKFTSGMLALVNQGFVNVQEDQLYLTEVDIDIISKGDTLIYFILEEDPEVAETFIQVLREEIENYPLVAYIINCEESTDLCLGEPFMISSLPQLKIMSEQIHDFEDELKIEKVMEWISSVYTYGIAQPINTEVDEEEQEQAEETVEQEDEYSDAEVEIEKVLEPEEKVPSDFLKPLDSRNKPRLENPLYLTEGNFKRVMSQYDACLVEFYLTDESDSYNLKGNSLKGVFEQLYKRYEADPVMLIARVNCKTYPRMCKKITSHPTVYHGFSGKLIREVPLTNDAIRNFESLVTHAEKMKKVVKKGKEMMTQNKEKIFELSIRNFGTEIMKYEISFVFFYTTACGRCRQCEDVWDKVSPQYSSNPLVLAARVDCNHNRGTCKQGNVKGNQVNVYYRGVYYKKYPRGFDEEELTEWLDKMYKSPPKGVFERSAGDAPREDDEPEGEGVVKAEGLEDGELIITNSNYNSTLKRNKLVFIKYYVPWCGHCKKLAPGWSELGESFKDVQDIIIGSVNCQNDKPLCKLHLVSAYPTLLLFIDGRLAYRHREDRSVYNMIEYVKSKYYDHIEDDLKTSEELFTVNANNVWNVLGVRGYSVVLFTANITECTACTATSDQFLKAMLAVRGNDVLAEKVMLATVDCVKDAVLCHQFKVLTVPHVVMFKDSETITNITNDQTLAVFKKLQTRINAVKKGAVLLDKVHNVSEAEWNSPLPEEPLLEEQVKSQEEITDLIKDSPASEDETVEGVLSLTQATFNAQLKQSKLTFVKFYTTWCTHCKKLAPIWNIWIQQAYVTNEDVVVAQVDCDKEGDLCDKFNVQVYPMLVMFDNVKKMKYVTKKRKVEELRQFVEGFLTRPKEEL